MKLKWNLNSYKNSFEIENMGGHNHVLIQRNFHYHYGCVMHIDKVYFDSKTSQTNSWSSGRSNMLITNTNDLDDLDDQDDLDDLDDLDDQDDL